MYREAPIPPAEKAAFEAACNTAFEGRLFAVGNPYTKTVLGKVGTFNEACDELMKDIGSGNAGNGTDIVEVDKDGNVIK